MNRSRILACLATAVAFIAMALTVASPASAAPTSTCTAGFPGPDCIFWGQAYNNSHSGVIEDVSNFPATGSTPYVYLSAGTGQGSHIGNNNGSNRNYDTVCVVTLYWNPGFGGPTVTLSPFGQAGYQKAGSGLGALLNNIRGQRFC